MSYCCYAVLFLCHIVVKIEKTEDGLLMGHLDLSIVLHFSKNFKKNKNIFLFIHTFCMFLTKDGRCREYGLRDATTRTTSQSRLKT